MCSLFQWVKRKGFHSLFRVVCLTLSSILAGEVRIGGWQSRTRVMQESNWKEKTGRPAVQLFTSLQIARVLHQHTARQNIIDRYCHMSSVIHKFSGNICSFIGRFVSHSVIMVCYWWKRLLHQPATDPVFLGILLE